MLRNLHERCSLANSRRTVTIWRILHFYLSVLVTAGSLVTQRVSTHLYPHVPCHAIPPHIPLNKRRS